MKLKLTLILILLCICFIQFIRCSVPNDNLIKDVKQTEYPGFFEFMEYGPYQNFTFKLNGVKYSTNIPKSHTFRQKEEFLKKIILGNVYTSGLSVNKMTLMNKVLGKLKVTKFYRVDEKREKKLLEKYNGSEVGILNVDVGVFFRGVDQYDILYVISSKKIILLDIVKL